MNLVNVCLGLPIEQEPLQSLPIWGSVAQTWILHSHTQDLLDYLLLRKKSAAIKPHLVQIEQVSERGSSMNSVAVKLVLGLCTTEVNSALDKWQNMKEQSAGHLDQHMVRMVGNLVTVALCIANCLQVKDTHRVEQLRAANEKLMVLLFSDLSSPACEQDKVDALIDLVAHRLLICQPDVSNQEGYGHHVCMARLSTSLLELFEKRRYMTQSESSTKKNETSDMMDFDTDFDSQVTTYTAPVNEVRSPRKVIPTNYSIMSQRASVTIYAMLMQSFDSSVERRDSIEDPTQDLISHVLDLPAQEILASGPLLTALPRYGVQLTPKQFEPLLEFFADNTLQSYEYERAETNVDLLLGVMESFVYTWTDASDQEFYTFGLD
ncbi:hypothetical protein KCU82_g21621, partial [Aureobasidium melanogenum]